MTSQQIRPMLERIWAKLIDLSPNLSASEAA
jgi:hypothetical protein